MKFKNVDGTEVVEIDVIDGRLFRVQAHDGIDNGVFLQPNDELSRKRIMKDFQWVNLLDQCGTKKTGPAGMLFYSRGSVQMSERMEEWPYLAFEKNYIELGRVNNVERN